MKRLDLIISAIEDALKDFATDSYGYDYRGCCGADLEVGHTADCKLAQALAAARELREELTKPVNEFNPDWDQIKPYHDRIAELEAQIALYKKADNARELGLDYEPEQEKLCVNCGKPTRHIGNKCYGCCQTEREK